MKEYYVHTTVHNIEKMADASKAKLHNKSTDSNGDDDNDHDNESG